MKWVDSINEILEAKDNNRLVIFVGAGVSVNSGLPSWRELIKGIADKIGYCHECAEKDKDCPKEECNNRYKFSPDELLRIPEYYYQKDPAGYNEYISKLIPSDKCSNVIDDKIFDLLPHHIITTNYDSLLEDSKNIYRSLYGVVAEDKDLLSCHCEQYLIKMHGDIKHPEAIVLKESDYIDYEQTHPLISTFIRALLINHSFLFLGYSLNDNNLKLIIGWVNYFQKKYDISKRQKNYLILCESINEFEQKRLESQNIYVIDISKISNEDLKQAKVPDTLKDEKGKELYTYLYAISEQMDCTGEIFKKYIERKCEILKNYNKITCCDLLYTYGFSTKAIIGASTLSFIEENWYNKVYEVIGSENEEIISSFRRAGITKISYFDNKDSCCSISKSNDVDAIFELYLNNDYDNIRKKVKDSQNRAEKVYYYHLLGEGMDKINTEIQSAYSELHKKDYTDVYISMLLWKNRELLTTYEYREREKLRREISGLYDRVPERYKNSIRYLREIGEFSIIPYRKMYESQCIENLQFIAYEYYFFCKQNYLPFDYHCNIDNYQNLYVKAIFRSYDPKENDLKCYQLNDIDLDIIVKYIEDKTLQKFLNLYSVNNIDLSQCTNIVEKYKNLCKFFQSLPSNDVRKEDLQKDVIKFTWVIICSQEDECVRQCISNTYKEILPSILKVVPREYEDYYENLKKLLTNPKNMI